VEFTIAGKNKPQKIGNVTVGAEGINQKRNQYSVVMTVEDKRFEKGRSGAERTGLLLHFRHSSA